MWKKAVCREDEDKNVLGSERSKYGSFCRVKGTHSNVMGQTGLASWTPSNCNEEEESKVEVAALSIGMGTFLHRPGLTVAPLYALELS